MLTLITDSPCLSRLGCCWHLVAVMPESAGGIFIIAMCVLHSKRCTLLLLALLNTLPWVCNVPADHTTDRTHALPASTTTGTHHPGYKPSVNPNRSNPGCDQSNADMHPRVSLSTYLSAACRTDSPRTQPCPHAMMPDSAHKLYELCFVETLNNHSIRMQKQVARVTREAQLDVKRT